MEIIENPYTVLVRRLNRIESLCEQILQKQKKKPEASQNPIIKYRNTEEAAEFLKLSKDRIYHLVNTGKLRCQQRGKGNRLLFKESDLIDYVENWE